MRISNNLIVGIGLLGAAFGLSPAVSFDGTRTPEAAPVSTPLPSPGSNGIGGATPLAPVPSPGSLLPSGALALPPRQSLTPFEAFRSGAQAVREGKVEQGVAELELAAKQNVAGALWTLGR